MECTKFDVLFYNAISRHIQFQFQTKNNKISGEVHFKTTQQPLIHML